MKIDITKHTSSATISVNSSKRLPDGRTALLLSSRRSDMGDYFLQILPKGVVGKQLPINVSESMTYDEAKAKIESLMEEKNA